MDQPPRRLLILCCVSCGSTILALVLEERVQALVGWVELMRAQPEALAREIYPVKVQELGQARSPGVETEWAQQSLFVKETRV